MPIGTRRAAARKAVKARRWRKPPLHIKEILGWADAHYEETGHWPTADSGRVRGTLEEEWRNVNQALRVGLRTLPPGDSLPRLLARFRGVRNRKGLPPYSIEQILQWADAYFAQHGRWPLNSDGKIAVAPGETWMAVEMALGKGLRGLPGGSSLAKLLAEHRGRRNSGQLPPFKINGILKWADSHHRRTGMWPTSESGPIDAVPAETWNAVDKALRKGMRGMRGGSSLARLLRRQRGVPLKHRRRPPLSVEQILAWADVHHERSGDWPNGKSGEIVEVSGETWAKVQIALIHGQRGLKGRSSLAKLFAEHRGVRNIQDLPEFNIKQILAWADAHFKRNGAWPSKGSGPVEDSPSNTWAAVNIALSRGLRGLKGGSSLARLLAERRGVRNRHVLPKFSTARVLAWSDAHHRRTGKWPHSHSGPIQEMPTDTWAMVDSALREGSRGLRGGSSLARLLERERGVLPRPRPPLSVDQVLGWADAYFKRHAAWPSSESGPVEGTLGETWATVDAALSRGRRGLPSRLSLERLLAERRGVPTRLVVPKFGTADILSWADAHHQHTGMWPNQDSGPIQEMPGVTWATVNRKLQRNQRGRSSLARLLKRQRGVMPKHRRKPPLSIETILEWGDAHHRRTGHWPRPNSGRIPEAPRDSWETVHIALRQAKRGLPAGLSLGKVWAKYRGVRNVHSIPKLSAEQILKWADAHYRRTGSWPQVRSGPIAESPADNWLSVENALRVGLRGLPGGSSLKRFLDEHGRNGQARRVAKPRPAARRQPARSSRH